MDDHASQAIGRPDLVRLDSRLICRRFETVNPARGGASRRTRATTGCASTTTTSTTSATGRWERQLAADATVIVIRADSGTRYVESVFDGHRADVAS